MQASTPKRVDLNELIPVKIQTPFNAGKGVLRNLSLSGAYVATHMYLLPQAQVRLSLVLREEKRWYETDAVVVWENRGTVGRRDRLPPGYGMRFVKAPKDTADLIRRLLEPTTADRATGSAPEPAQPTESPSFGDGEPEAPPYRVTAPSIARHVPEDQPGVFVLSYDRTQEARVGRADSDLKSAIAAFEGEYAYFYCEIIERSEDRYYRECELFHRLGGDRGQLDNDVHPSSPGAGRLDCPVCVTEARSGTRR